MEDQTVRDQEDGGDGVDRRGFLKCMAWAGTGLLWSIGGGVLSSRAIGQANNGGYARLEIANPVETAGAIPVGPPS